MTDDDPRAQLRRLAEQHLKPLDDDVSGKYFATAVERILPTLDDAATCLLHDLGRGFTHEDRSIVSCTLLTAAIVRHIQCVVETVPNACCCNNCLGKRFEHIAKVFVLGLANTMMSVTGED